MAKTGGTRKSGAAVKRRALRQEIADEPDSEWRAWFERVERLKKEQSDPGRRKLVFSRPDPVDNPERGVIVRKQSAPGLLKSFMKSGDKKSGRGLNIDLALLVATWRQAVGADIAEATSVYSFKNGVLTIQVDSSSLLQEIRQFHQEAIYRDLIDSWQLSMPLLKIIYKQGRA